MEAEKLAWDFARESGLDVITILPNFVLGPVVGPGQGGVSTGFMKSFLEAPDGKVRHTALHPLQTLACCSPGLGLAPALKATSAILSVLSR